MEVLIHRNYNKTKQNQTNKTKRVTESLFLSNTVVSVMVFAHHDKSNEFMSTSGKQNAFICPNKSCKGSRFHSQCNISQLSYWGIPTLIGIGQSLHPQFEGS